MAPTLELKGYRIVQLNLIDMDQSDGYNPFEYIRSDNDIIKLVTNMMKNTMPKGASSSDPFWENALSLYLQAIMSYVWYECPKQGKKATIRSIIISAHARFAYLQNPKVLRILDRDDINIQALGEGVYENPDRKTALFCVIPDNDKSYNFLVGVRGYESM